MKRSAMPSFSGIGGLFGVIIMLLFTPVLAKFALVGPAEQFLVCVLGLAVVGS